VSRKICKEIEDNIIRELASEKQLIDDKAIPVRSHNYSYIQHQVRKKYAQKVSLTTIISRGESSFFAFKKERRRFTTGRYQTIMLEKLSSNTLLDAFFQT